MNSYEKFNLDIEIERDPLEQANFVSRYGWLRDKAVDAGTRFVGVILTALFEQHNPDRTQEERAYHGALFADSLQNLPYDDGTYRRELQRNAQRAALIQMLERNCEEFFIDGTGNLVVEDGTETGYVIEVRAKSPSRDTDAAIQQAAHKETLQRWRRER